MVASRADMTLIWCRDREACIAMALAAYEGRAESLKTTPTHTSQGYVQTAMRNVRQKRGGETTWGACDRIDSAVDVEFTKLAYG
eukprot:6186968-Pleurochrysis_carterae.AAC.9